VNSVNFFLIQICCSRNGSSQGKLVRSCRLESQVSRIWGLTQCPCQLQARLRQQVESMEASAVRTSQSWVTAKKASSVSPMILTQSRRLPCQRTLISLIIQVRLRASLMQKKKSRKRKRTKRRKRRRIRAAAILLTLKNRVTSHPTKTKSQRKLQRKRKKKRKKQLWTSKKLRRPLGQSAA